MPKRVNNDAQTNIRLPQSMKEEIDEAARNNQISTMEWIRRACQEKLDRDSGKSTAEHDEKIKQAVYEVLKEMGYKDKGGEA
jgi:metal-responsive CopG/Arc/MetJ family transcriptional regulator